MNALLLKVAISLPLAVGLSQPVAAQEASYRMGWVQPEIVCRTGPSYSTDVARLITLSGEGWGAEEWVRRTETSEAGDVWVHLESLGCWVPESALARTDGAGHLLQMANRLLSTAVTPLEHFLVAHNLFVHPRYRQQVEESTVLTRRRLELLTRAVEAAQTSRLNAGRPVDNDPMLLAWIESFGDEIRYSKNRWGIGTWTVTQAGMASPPPLPRLREEASEDPPEAREFAIIAPDVACREQLSPGAPGGSLPVDSHFSTVRADTSAAGETWVLVRSKACWVAARHTAPGGTDQHVSRIVERFLTSGEGWSLDGFLRVYNVLSSRNRGHAEVVEASAILGLRRLEVLGEALDFLSPRSVDALTLAWVGSLGDEVAVTAEGHAWTVGDSAYLSLHEKHRGHPFAEEIMWKFASESDAYSCEGDYSCVVEQRVAIRLARYWRDYPRGQHVAEAIERARALLAHGLETCNAARGTEPGSREANAWLWTYWGQRGADIAKDLVATLAGVGDDDKGPLVDVLGALEACAAIMRSPGRNRTGGR
ncbi:hypothetical protein [Candidatus Palauibacter sp.]|uniref:hypothetical protein n=1 Tax=Candidatus Palauibacter sp. TaxID=3101350 RepID=UPI003B51D276